MSKGSSYGDIFQDLINIIKNNSPEKSLLKISKLSNPKTNKKIGINKAYAIYKVYIDYSEEYDKKKYAHNVALWDKKIARNLKLAEEAYERLK
jgi:hypothetical protein